MMRCAPTAPAAAPAIEREDIPGGGSGGAGSGREHRGEGDGGECDRDEDVAEMDEGGEGIRPLVGCRCYGLHQGLNSRFREVQLAEDLFEQARIVAVLRGPGHDVGACRAPDSPSARP